MEADLKTILKLLRKIRAHQEDPTGEKAKARAANNGFNRNLEVSPELREFLALGPEDTVSRSEVTRRINTYINENGLKHPDNGRMIILDNKLLKLLEPPDGVQVTFLNIQKYLSKHYVKKESGAAPASGASAPEVPPSSDSAAAETPAPTKKKVVRKPKAEN
jgi:upstream activation factor subunit UAF30